MQYKGVNLCDFCFEPISPGAVCPYCGLDHDSYKAEAGLLKPGANLNGNYIIGRVLGRGGFGATYLAFSSVRNEAVAIKEYFPTGIAHRGQDEEKVRIVSDDKRRVFEKGANRFFEEAKTMSRFNSNKNVVSVYEFFHANDTVYYSMEYLKGIDLKGYIAKKGGRINEAEAVTIMRGVCDALVAVHSTQTLHRDISPDNIYICTDGDVKLIDFGAAKQVVGEHAQQNYSVVVKQGFAPAEQYNSNGRQGVWTDIYALGATMYYALTGKVPPAAMDRVDNPNISFDANLNISKRYADIINKCLQIKIEDRYQSAIELVGDLNSLNIPNVKIGGNEYVQTVYNGVGSTGLAGGSVVFSSNPSRSNPYSQTGQTGYNPFAQSQYPNSQINPNMSQYPYPQSQYPQSQYPQSGYGQKKDNSMLMRGIIIGLVALVAVIIIVVLIVVLTQPPGPPMGPPGGMPPGGPPPGMPGGPPPMQ